MTDNYEFVTKENDANEDFDYSDAERLFCGDGFYECEIKKASKKTRKKLEKYIKKRTPKSNKFKKMKKRLSKLETELEKIKKEKRKEKIEELINCDSSAQRKQLAKELFEEVN